MPVSDHYSGSRPLPATLFFRILLPVSIIVALLMIRPCPAASGNTTGSGTGGVDPEWGRLDGEQCHLPGVDLSGPGFVHMCDEKNSKNWFIYCQGRLFEAIRYHRLKEFNDAPLARDATQVWANFERQFGGAKADVTKIDKTELLKFLEENFDKNRPELKECELPDWTASPPKLSQIRDPALKQWALKLNGIWKELCRRIPEEVKTHEDRHSLIYVSQPFIIPGGHFQEFYYWDTYWSIKGLLASGLTHTVRDMLQNFFEMVDRFGFVPNGGRVKYSRRSQPPFLVMMVEEYMNASNDMEFLRKALPFLEKEFEFWHRHRSVPVALPDTSGNAQPMRMFRYRVDTNVPRCESFCADLLMARDASLSPDQRRQMWADIASAAESGWDFSTRWMREPRAPDMRTIETANVLPVELNAFICGNYAIMARMYDKIGNSVKSREYQQQFDQFRQDFHRVFWSENGSGPGWYDLNLRTGRHNLEFYASAVAPLFTGCYTDARQPERVYRTMRAAGALDQPGGVPTSMIRSRQQWDFPNGWPPLNHMTIEAFRRTGTDEMRKAALELAQKWITTNYVAHKRDGKMWEKYTVDTPERLRGGGGEYEVVAGFGWTNGVVLDLLATYGDQLTVGV